MIDILLWEQKKYIEVSDVISHNRGDWVVLNS